VVELKVKNRNKTCLEFTNLLKETLSISTERFYYVYFENTQCKSDLYVSQEIVPVCLFLIQSFQQTNPTRTMSRITKYTPSTNYYYLPWIIFLYIFQTGIIFFMYI